VDFIRQIENKEAEPDGTLAGETEDVGISSDGTAKMALEESQR
jgi:hypothetical protein